MEEKNKNEELKQQETNEASPVARASYSTGTGMGPNDCMSQDFFNSLNDRGAISGTIYVCGYGWITAGSSASGCGCGSGCGSIPSCICGCCSYDLCSCISTGCGCGSGSGCGGSGCGSSDSHNCACSCYYCGAFGCGAGSGSVDPAYESKIREARKPENVRNSKVVLDCARALWKTVIDYEERKKELNKELTDEEYAEIKYKRREAACYIYYRPADGQYYIGTTKYGETVSGDVQASVYLGSSHPTNNGVPKDAICITTCHTHTPLLYGSYDQERGVGPSSGDYDFLSSGDESNYGIVLDYTGHYVQNMGYYIFPGHSVTDTPMMYIYYNNGEPVDKYSFTD